MRRKRLIWAPLPLQEAVDETRASHLGASHQARAVWAFVEGLDLSPIYGEIKAVEGAPGRPPIDPKILIALWLYATIDGVGSAREVDRLCREHAALAHNLVRAVALRAGARSRRVELVPT